MKDVIAAFLSREESPIILQFLGNNRITSDAVGVLDNFFVPPMKHVSEVQWLRLPTSNPGGMGPIPNAGEWVGWLGNRVGGG